MEKKDKMKQNLLLYRGDNPLFKRLSEELASEGFVAESVPEDDGRASFSADARELRKAYIDQIKGQYNKIFTDHTMHEKGFENVVDVYQLVNNDRIWPEQIRVIADHFKREGRIPVINPYGLTHHFFSVDGLLKNLEAIIGEEKAREYKAKAEGLDLPSDYNDNNTKSVHLASLLGDIIGVRIIPYASQKRGQEEEGFVMAKGDGYSSFEDRKYKGNIIDTLRKMNIDPKDAVVLVDHHVYELREDDVRSSGFDQVNIYPICVCCYGLDPNYRGSLEEHGFNVVGSEIESDVFYPQLLQKIREQ